jgi:hypothetical protein
MKLTSNFTAACILCASLGSADSFTLTRPWQLVYAKWISIFLEPFDTSSNIQPATINTTQCFNVYFLFL